MMENMEKSPVNSSSLLCWSESFPFDSDIMKQWKSTLQQTIWFFPTHETCVSFYVLFLWHDSWDSIDLNRNSSNSKCELHSQVNELIYFNAFDWVSSENIVFRFSWFKLRCVGSSDFNQFDLSVHNHRLPVHFKYGFISIWGCIFKAISFSSGFVDERYTVTFKRMLIPKLISNQSLRRTK